MLIYLNDKKKYIKNKRNNLIKLKKKDIIEKPFLSFFSFIILCIGGGEALRAAQAFKCIY